MNIIEKIIQKIKNFLFRNNQKKLTDGSESKPNKKETFLSRIKRSNTSQHKIVKNKHLEHSLGQFFEQLSYLNQKDANGLGSHLFYKALVGINALEGNTASNSIYEDKLSDEIWNPSSNYQIKFQYSGNDPVFYHVRTKQYISPNYSDMKRLYINCKNENVAKLTHELLKHNNDSQFYLKAGTSAYLKTNPRSEKIVIYSTNKQFDSHIKLIDSIKQLNPTLFEGSEKTNPFMPTYHGICYSSQPVSSEYKLVNGKNIEIAQSSNSFIAQTIQESYMETLREIAPNDPKLSFLLEPENIDDETAYASVCQYVNSKHHVYLINSMEEKMKSLCTTNNLEINGINCNNTLEKKESEVNR